MEQIKIKVERMTFLKRSIGVLNLQHDKKEVMDIDECDVEEFNKLLEAKDMRNDEVPTRIEEWFSIKQMMPSTTQMMCFLSNLDEHCAQLGAVL